MKKKEFLFKFIDKSQEGVLDFEYDEESEEKLVLDYNNRLPILCGNKEGFLTLAKILIKISKSESYKDGFHIHLCEDFNVDKQETLAITLLNPS